MAPPADIAELQRSLERCCADLAAAVAAAEKEHPIVPDGEGPGGVPLDPKGVPVPGAPQWQPLALAPLPGLDTLLSIIEPPLQIIIALLKVIAALLEALAAIMLGIADIFRALILAAVALLRDIINDLANTGAYMYVDVPGVMPTEVDIRETGIFIDPAADWKAGRTLQSPPLTPDGFTRWATRFAASFDDPGDLNRPVVTEGAPIQALFIVMAAPSLDAIRQLIYLLGRLFNIDRFKLAFERYENASHDPRLVRARKSKGVPPDWRSKRLRDILPLDGLLMLPDTLMGLLTTVDNLAALIKNLAAAIQDKANLLLQLAEAVQKIIDLLAALKSTGMYSLGVATQGGVAGLRNAFMTATNRPPGGYIGGVCFMASGPNLAKASMLFDMLGGTAAIEIAEGDLSVEQALKQGALGKATAVLERAGETASGALDAFKTTVRDEGNAFVDAIDKAPQTFHDELGRTRDEILREAAGMRSLAVESIQNAGVFLPDLPHIQSGVEATRQAQRYGARSLALGFGTREPDSLLREPDVPTAPADGGGEGPASGGK